MAALKAKLPARFLKEMTEMEDVLKQIQKVASNNKSCDKSTTILELSKVTHPDSLKQLKCFTSDLLSGVRGFEDMSLIIFQFSESVAKLVHVGFLDQLHEVVNQSGHPNAALILEEKWMAVVAPKSDLPQNFQACCWSILRDGFCDAPPMP